jgi:uncharacterized membrane protein YfcA
LLVVPSLVTNAWQMRPWRTLAPLARQLAGLLLGVCAGTWLGAWLMGAPAGAWARIALGVALIAYAAWSLAGAVLLVPPRARRWLGPLAGAATGLVTAATGVFVVPAVPYLQALGLQRDAFVQAMGLSFTVSTLALAVGLAGNASFTGGTLGWSLLMLAPALLGMSLGARLRRHLSPLWFRRCLMVGLLLLGSHMVLT